MNTIRGILTLFSACGAALLAQAPAAQTRFETLSTFGGTNPIGLARGGGAVYGAAAFLYPTDAEMCGSFFELQPPASPGESWTETTIYTIVDNTGSNGCIPSAAPMPGPGGLYGTTTYGGANDDGTLYELQPPSVPGGAWTETVLYSFDLINIGTGLPGPPTPGPNGSFYCSVAGAAYSYGALVQLEPPSVPGGAWTESVLYNYSYALGAYALVPGPGSVLYGTDGAGTIVQLSPPAAAGDSWAITVLYTLTAASDGLSPNSLTLASDGTLYGTTLGTDFYGYGAGDATVFQLIPPATSGGGWTFTVLHNFGKELNLNSPLILRNGNLYGTVDSSTGGQVFELQPPATTGGAWTLVHLYQFTGDQLPGGTLVMDKDGALFGVTAAPSTQPPGGTVYLLQTKQQ